MVDMHFWLHIKHARQTVESSNTPEKISLKATAVSIRDILAVTGVCPSAEIRFRKCISTQIVYSAHSVEKHA